jgi:hypothetical protein
LESLASSQASGVFQIEGSPAGTIYFDRGQITFARASWTPDLSARLLRAMRPSSESRELLTGGDRPDRDIGTILILRNYLSRAELQQILRSVVVDAIMALTIPSDEDAFISDVRFTAPVAHWAGNFSSIDFDAVQAEATRRAGRMARHGLSRTTPVQLHDLARPAAVLSRQQWALACTIDGAWSAQDLAWQCGLALYEAIEDVGALVEAGLCVPCPAEAPAPPPPGPLAQWFGTVTTDPRVPESGLEPVSAILPAPVSLASVPLVPVPPASVSPVPSAQSSPAVPLPRRTQRTRAITASPALVAEGGAAAAELPASADYTPPPTELLRRVLDGLRRNS